MRLEAQGLCFGYPHAGEILRDVSIAIESGERVGLVGPSGCGKSTLSKLLAGYLRPRKGVILLDGAPISRRGYHPVQLLHQHPEQAVNPRWRMRSVLEETGCNRPELLSAAGIEPDWLTRYPRELSGGELQRFCIARALGAGTRFLIADEATAMMDAVTQAQIWELLLAQAGEQQWGLLVITHNQALAKRVCTRIIPFTSLTEVLI